MIHRWRAWGTLSSGNCRETQQKHCWHDEAIRIMTLSHSVPDFGWQEDSHVQKLLGNTALRPGGLHVFDKAGKRVVYDSIW